jgi:site-specific DNA-cytosine methylase
MKWDQPASTLTMNSGVISSDVKGHPDQHRVLSLREILILSTLDLPLWKKEYSFEGVSYGRMTNDQSFSSRLIREVIGESIPPLVMKILVKHLLLLEK